MIRRTINLDGAPHWLLIPQPAHAGLSGALAAAWRAPIVSYPPAEDEVRQAILRHDDGWAAWERRPELDPATGAPYSFTELPRPTALQLWEGSIAAASAIGPLAGSAVAGHFLKLLETSDEADEPFAVAWTDKNAALRSNLLTRYAARRPDADIDALAAESLAAVRLFDWISLWLCCYGPLGYQDFEQPIEPLVTDDGTTFTPHAMYLDGAVHVAVDPWPLNQDRLACDIRGLCTSVRCYLSTDELVANSRPSRIRWRFHPEGVHGVG
ncbi:hypothetical protein Pla175_06900 [Pirellulimonas nuda]|uniref:DUF3891 domain-containing protein n=1 Tax=Pirellulimonas nuda TaxID=2528009 RepID=A0A518D796_9BACT|nr:DUF3891 family protein [Pirellulimonas nuda]QDU87331.1 hypothetical protein Pla175_06900 [Pirellulimonas nuda]